MNADSLSPRVLNKIFSEWPLLEQMPKNKVNDLICGLMQMKKFGVDSFAKRLIDKKGYSAMFCTNVLWSTSVKNKSFSEDYTRHVSAELVNTHKNKIKIISRSGDKVHSPFLEKLQKEEQNNSIIINNFYKNEIEINYFMASPYFPEDRDLILNNLQHLNFIKERLDIVLKEICISSEFQEKKELLLNNTAINILLKQSSREQKLSNSKYDLHWLEHRDLKKAFS